MPNAAHKRIIEAQRRAEEVAEFYSDLASVFERAGSLGLDLFDEIQRLLCEAGAPAEAPPNGSVVTVPPAPGSGRERLLEWYRGAKKPVGRQVALGVLLFGVARTNRAIADEISRLGFTLGAKDPVGYVRNILLPEVKKRHRLRSRGGTYEIASPEAEASIREELKAKD